MKASLRKICFHLKTLKKVKKYVRNFNQKRLKEFYTKLFKRSLVFMKYVDKFNYILFVPTRFQCVLNSNINFGYQVYKKFCFQRGVQNAIFM